MYNRCADCANLSMGDRKNNKIRCAKKDEYIDARRDALDCFKMSNKSVRECDEAAHYCYTVESSGCFITTAVVQILGKDDNDKVLMGLRNFRNNVLQKEEKYDQILREYDFIGPKIAELLIESKNNKNLAERIYSILAHICELVKKGDYNSAVFEYRKMVIKIAASLNITTYAVGENINSADSLKGHARLK